MMIIRDAVQFHPGRIYGLTHEFTGVPKINLPRTVKVGIGMVKGRGLHVYINRKQEWCIAMEGEKNIEHPFPTRDECQEAFAKLRKTAPERAFPRKLSYFTFTKIDSEGLFEPEWEAIAAHGPFPTEIDIVFVTDRPLTAHHQMWTAAEMKCEGDGIHARRVLSMAKSGPEVEAAKIAAEQGERFFPILNACRERGCGYAKETEGKNGKTIPAPCKPHGRLLFQLIASPRLGGTATFDTTSFRSIGNLFSGIETFKTVTGNGDAERGYVAGIPLKLCVRPFKHSKGSSYCVSLEFRAESPLALRRGLIAHAEAYRAIQASAKPAPQLAPPAWEGPETVEYEEPPEQTQAEMLEAEFYAGDAEDDFGEPGAMTRAERIEAAATTGEYDMIPEEVQARFRDQMTPTRQREATAALEAVNEILRDARAADPKADLATLANLRLSVFVAAAKKRTPEQMGGDW